MKVCYLVLAHAKPAHTARNLAALADPASAVVVHVDRKAELRAFTDAAPPAPHVHWVEDRAVVKHHGWGIVDGTLRAMRLAMARAPDADYFALVSADSYPLRSQAGIREFLRERAGTEWMNLLPLPAPQVLKPMSKLTRYYIDHDPRGSALTTTAVKIAHQFIPPRDYRKALKGMRPYCGSQWWVLSGAAVRHLLSQVDERPEYVRFCMHTRTPDEHFFHILLANSPFAGNIRPNLMYADFAVRPGPAEIADRHLDAWTRAGHTARDDEYGHHEAALFARKFGDDSERLTARVRELLW